MTDTLKIDTEDGIIQRIKDKFDFANNKISVKKKRRVITEPFNIDEFFKLLDFVIKEENFTHLCTITGLDEGDEFHFVYHIARRDGIVLNLKLSQSKDNAIIKTISDFFPSAIIYERELEDMFGVKVQGLPPGNRYPLPENWPEGNYPLRKDWKKEMLDSKVGETNGQ